jgi:hypothetical protein
MPVDLREGATCCFALQDKAWVDDPDRVPWEIYTVLADADVDVVDDAGAPISSREGCAAHPPAEPSATHCC